MKLRTPLTLVAALAAVAACAQVTSVSVNRLQNFTQTSDGAAADAYFFADTFLNTTGLGSGATGTLTLPDGSTTSGLPETPGSSTLRFIDVYGTLGELQTAYPAGGYGIAVDAGDLAGTTGTYTLPEAVYADAQPFLTGDSYTRLQGVGAGSAVSLTFTSATNLPSSGYSFVAIIDDASGAEVFLSYVNGSEVAGFTGVTVPANTLMAARNYHFELGFVNSAQTTASFASPDDTTLYENFYKVTRGNFSTSAVPEPASLAALGLGAAALLRRRRK